MYNTSWFKYDRDWLRVNKSQFVPVIFEPPCTMYCNVSAQDWNLVFHVGRHSVEFHRLKDLAVN
jgi:hypothetical protein